jgi:hypothetical protein
MKIKVFTTIVALALSSALSQAVPLLPGAMVNPNVDSIGGGATLVGSLTGVNFVTPGSASVSGTVDSWVYSGDVNNTYGGLTFVYKVNVTAGTVVEGLNLNNFSGVQVDVATDGSGVIPSFANRGIVGTPVRFEWLTGIAVGSSSSFLLIRTDATAFEKVLDGVKDGTTVNVTLLGPAVPDGGMTLVLLGTALTAMGLIRRKMA